MGLARKIPNQVPSHWDVPTKSPKTVSSVPPSLPPLTALSLHTLDLYILTSIIANVGAYGRGDAGDATQPRPTDWVGQDREIFLTAPLEWDTLFCVPPR